jgi:hypothetical protein
MRAHIKTKARGKIRFFEMHENGQIITGRDDVPVFRDESGFLRRCGHWQDNLITDIGLDQMAVRSFLSDGTGSGRNRLKLGSGSDLPATTDTALQSYVTDTAANGGFTHSFQRSFESGNLVMKQLMTRVHENTTGSGQTFTELGFSHATGNAANIRELFRDEADDPVSISIPNLKKLRVDHMFEQQQPFETALSFDRLVYDASDTLIDTVAHTGKLYVFQSVDGSSGGSEFGGGSPDIRVSSDRPTFTTPLDTWTMANFSGITSATAGYSNQVLTETPARFSHTRRTKIIESQGNALSIASIYLRTSGTGNSMWVGHAIVLDSPQVLPKDADHIYFVDLIFTVGRA